MTNRYDSMVRLRDHLEELFQICGVQTQDICVNLSPMLVRIAEKLTKDDALQGYFDSLDIQTQQAIQKMKDWKLDNWNNEQNEIRIQEQEQELEQKRNRIHELELALEQEHNYIKEQERNYYSMQTSKNSMERYESDGNLPNEKLEMIQNIIAMRDRLLLQKSWAKDIGDGEENVVKVIDGQLKETAKCLKNAGVEILESEDGFDSSYQTVVETCLAETPEQVERITETFRPGYRFQNEILRPQEVILFVKEQV